MEPRPRTAKSPVLCWESGTTVISLISGLCICELLQSLWKGYIYIIIACSNCSSLWGYIYIYIYMKDIYIYICTNHCLNNFACSNSLISHIHSGCWWTVPAVTPMARWIAPFFCPSAMHGDHSRSYRAYLARLDFNKSWTSHQSISHIVYIYIYIYACCMFFSYLCVNAHI